MPFSLSGRPFDVEALMFMDGSPAGFGWEYDPTVLTYSFSTNANSTFRSIYNTALAELESYLNIDFQQVSDETAISSDFSNFFAQNGSDTSADLRFSRATDAGGGGVALAYWWTNDADSDMEDLDSANIIWTVNEYTILHEIGHALTLKHTGPEQDPSEEPYLPEGQRNNNYTVMHYYGTDGIADPDLGEWDYHHFQLYDVYALQLRFGANMSTYSGNNTHSATSLAVDQWLKVLWDAGGTDTIDMSAQSRDQLIDLRQGEFSNLGPTAGNNPFGYNLAVAFNAVIENATGGSGGDFLFGNSGNNVLQGGGGNDYLVGGAGDDYMVGGTGDDTYYIDDTGDGLSEFTGEGNDRVAASISMALAGDAFIELIEAINLTATNAMDLTGSDIANSILGNNGVNILRGQGGNDTLNGFGGNDFLVGGTGTDLMIGSAGDDTFYVDDASDSINEVANEGNDRIAASVSYVLSNDAHIELLEAVNLAATNAMDLTGSDSANTVTGNDGVNILRGEGGNDTINGAGGDDLLLGGTGNDLMAGGTGNDTYYVDAAGDTVQETSGQGTADRVAAEVSYALSANADIELLEAVTQSATNAMDFTGSSIANTIVGNDGANLLDGKGGGDTLIGLGGADGFTFTTALGGGNVDTIVGFVSTTDEIRLDDAIFTTLSPGALSAGAFVVGTAAQDANDRIVYNNTTGALLYDADGNGGGAAVQFATLDGHPTLAASDFLIF